MSQRNNETFLRDPIVCLKLQSCANITNQSSLPINVVVSTICTPYKFHKIRLDENLLFFLTTPSCWDFDGILKTKVLSNMSSRMFNSQTKFWGCLHIWVDKISNLLLLKLLIGKKCVLPYNARLKILYISGKFRNFLKLHFKKKLKKHIVLPPPHSPLPDAKNNAPTN